MQVKPGYWDIPQMQKQNITLELLEPGAIIGVSEILSSVSCPTAIASKESSYLTIKVSDFLKLLSE